MSKRDLVPEPRHFSSSITALGLCSEWQRALWLWRDAKDIADAEGFSIMATALASSKQWMEALEVLADMREQEQQC
ncbi:unnamed protein product [Durusdinium trenchii]